MSERVFLMAIHNHQPVGNFESVFEAAFRDCYRPLLETLKDHPRFKVTLHFSGPLWEHMQRKERTCWELVGEMVARGQAELLAGGFYEPILPVIPEDDRLDQIHLMCRFLKRNFGFRARGLWLAERVWEPSLPRSLARAGMEYTLLDEEHFHYAGVDDIHASYITEDEGASLRVFPIDKTLRYLIPFHPVEEVGSYVSEIHDRGGLAILGDDGEKFGLWPGTHKLVYEEKWLTRFLDALDRAGVVTRTFSECLDALPPRERVYIPPASYEEMMEWVLEPEDQAALKRLKDQNPGQARRFIRGGFFRDFFRKYPESNNLYKRMLLVSRRARRRPDEDVLRRVFRAQGNDPYWHGVFGGLYLPHLRQAAYRNIIEAEALMPLTPGWTRTDYDDDGLEEAVHRSRRHSLFVKPSYGGSLVSLDSRRLGRNMLDVLSRRREAYHLRPEEGTAEGKSIHELARRLPPGSEHLLRPDSHLRYSLMDHMFAAQTVRDDVLQGRAQELGDFLGAHYEFRVIGAQAAPGGKPRGSELHLSRSGHVLQAGRKLPCLLRKRITPLKDGLEIVCELKNLSPAALVFLFGSEWNFSAFPGEFEVEGQTVHLYDRTARLEAERADDLWFHPLQTLSQSEKGYDILHQGVCFLPVWKVSLGAGASVAFRQIFTEDHGR